MSDVADIVHRLYGLPPEQFVAARNAAAADLTGADAKAVKALRRPTVAAAAVNRLVRERPAVVQVLADLGDRLREAQAAGDGDTMRELDKERRMKAFEAYAAAVALSRAPTTAGDGIKATLQAVVLDPDSAAAVLEGNLATTLSASGFATISTGAPGRRRTPRKRPAKADDRAAERAERLAEARRHLERTRAELAEADTEADTAEDARDVAADALDDAAGRLEAARAALAEAEQAHDGATAALRSADRELDAAREQADAAGLAVSAAERDVAALEKDAEP